MKRIKCSKLLDIIVVDDPVQIRALSNDPRVDRIFDRRPFLNGLLLKRRLSVLSYRGNRFPHMVPKGDVARAERDNALWDRFNDKAPAIAEGPDELEPRYHLTHSSLSVKGIAHLLGFDDPNYFSYFFRRSCNCSPGDLFRSKNGK